MFDIIGTTASGWLTDRYDPRVLLAWYYGLRGLSLLALPVVLDVGSVPLLLFMLFYGLDWVATVPPTVALCAKVAGPAADDGRVRLGLRQPPARRRRRRDRRRPEPHGERQLHQRVPRRRACCAPSGRRWRSASTGAARAAGARRAEAAPTA